MTNNKKFYSVNFNTTLSLMPSAIKTNRFNDNRRDVQMWFKNINFNLYINNLFVDSITQDEKRVYVKLNANSIYKGTTMQKDKKDKFEMTGNELIKLISYLNEKEMKAENNDK